MQADIESDVELAEKKYRTVVKFYRYFKDRDYALLKICEILDLKSDWKKLHGESVQGIKIFSQSRYITDFRFMYITSSMMLNRLGYARNECMRIAKSTHDPALLSRAIYYLAEINRKKRGNSRAYIRDLAQLAVGFKNSDLYPSIVFKLAEFYRHAGSINMAYSAYRDIAQRFPEAPESEMAIERMDSLKVKKPEIVNYIPGKKYIESTSTIDIQPERYEQENRKDIYYAISVGPFSKEKKAADIKKLLKNYPEIEMVRTNFGFTIYLGRFSNTDRALAMRIRLAEEFGINGQIVRISENRNRSYIYKD